jgi:pyrimidine and pyridine-specific 5'-nucleotidase
MRRKLCRLGLQGCFDGVICFETLNPCTGLSEFQNSTLFPDETSPNLVDLNESDGFRPISPILCKPSIEAMEAVIRIANVDPKKTVRILFSET